MKHTNLFVVTAADTAACMGSGTLDVLATPRLAAWMEQTAMEIIQVPPEQTTVGIALDVKHLKASAVGERIRCEADIAAVDGRRTMFQIDCYNDRDELIGTAAHTRVTVDVARFMEHLKH